MRIDTVNGLLDVLFNYQLLTPEQLLEVGNSLRGQFSQPQGLAQHLHEIGWLTAYQLNALLQHNLQALVLGSYRLIDQLGKGGVSRVYKARHIRHGFVVALKVVAGDMMNQPEIVARFRREVRIVAKLNHPNIVRAIDAKVTPEFGYMAMEFVDGCDLDRIVQAKKCLPYPMACDYIRQAALGLHHAHTQGLIHRDIKPGNLLVAQVPPGTPGASRFGLVKVLDLGLARPSNLSPDSGFDPNVTAEGTTLGTPDYMAPEQARSVSTVDGRADIYSLGCTLYYCLTGQVPFPGGSTMQKLFRHQSEEPLPVRSFAPTTPPPLAQIVQRMMAKRREQRIGSAEEVASLLEPFCDPDD
jgi:serine/threonine protein kinase